MKPRIVLTSVVFAVILTVEIFGGGKPENCLLFSLASGNMARLGVVNTSKKSLDLEIISSDGSVFFSKSISAEENYFQILDLSKMNDGEYQVKLAGSDQKYEKKFVVKNNSAKLIIKEKEVDPVFQLINNETLVVSYSNVNNKKVSIYFELDQEVVFEEMDLSGSQITKKYSLKKLPKGKYSVKLNAGGKLYDYPLVIK
jgi:hypothetical protein